MELAPRRNLFLHVDVAAPLALDHAALLRAAAQQTTDELAVFVSLADVARISESAGWSQMQRRVAEIYAAAAPDGAEAQALDGPETDVLLLDFCAYTPDDMAPYMHHITWATPADCLALPGWWPPQMRATVVARHPEGLSNNSATAAQNGQQQQQQQQQRTTRTPLPWTSFSHVAVGGTFDHLHIGHKILLTATALATTSRVLCAISAEPLLANKRHRDQLEPYRTRELNVLLFLRRIRKDIIVELAPLTDIYGPTATDGSITALVVSQETLPVSAALNVRRAENALPPMCLLPIDLLDVGDGSGPVSISTTTNSARKISSTAIRAALAERQRAGGSQ
ncbi:hypothetical protein H4R18_003647 [Coemansia javaensis]|uniref:Cytidyltransferase-like domain-containing protein n=1 Tax=Coemansia javaensis TaxID=2761396 RepID=A0A9W8LI33_9FUNG|nr:hypothetical protein H4R18_003647 [Coemansia javaensis]